MVIFYRKIYVEMKLDGIKVMEQNYCIRWAVLKDLKNIKEFFNREWKKSQTIHDEKLFKYYYVNGNKLNFVIALQDDKIVGACGFIIANSSDVWLSNLLVKKGEDPTLVLRIIKFLKKRDSIFVEWVLKKIHKDFIRF